MENNETEIEEGVAQSEMDIGSESAPLNVISFEEMEEHLFEKSFQNAFMRSPNADKRLQYLSAVMRHYESVMFNNKLTSIENLLFDLLGASYGNEEVEDDIQTEPDGHNVPC